MSEPGKFVSYNGEIVSPSSVNAGFSSRAFRYGDSLFESVRVIKTKPMFLDKHLSRLMVSMSILKMEPVVAVDYNNVSLYIDKLLKSNRFFSGCRLRITLYREGGGFYRPDSNRSHLLIEAFTLESSVYEVNPKGLRVDIYPEIKKPCNPLSSMKSGNAMLFVLASEWCMRNDLDDCLIINENSNICEATSSNVFIFRKGTLLTPSLDEGCVAGIMREAIIEKAISTGMTVYDDTYISQNELLSAEEIFLTNAVKGVQPVLAYKNKRYYNKVAKQFQEMIIKEA